MAYSLTYTYTYDDFVALIRAKRSLGTMGKLGPATPYVAVSLLYLVLVVATFIWNGISIAEFFETGTLIAILGGVLLVLFLVWLIDFVFLHFVYHLLFRRFAIADKKLTITLNDEGAQWTANGLSGQCLWSNVTRSIETGDYLFLFFSKVEGLPLPRRAMKSDQEFKALAGYVRERVDG